MWVHLKRSGLRETEASGRGADKTADKQAPAVHQDEEQDFDRKGAISSRLKGRRTKFSPTCAYLKVSGNDCFGLRTTGTDEHLPKQTASLPKVKKPFSSTFPLLQEN